MSKDYDDLEDTRGDVECKDNIVERGSLSLKNEISSTHSTSRFACDPPLVLNKQLTIWITYINVFIFALCFQFHQAIEPFLVESITIVHRTEEDVEAGTSAVAKIYGDLQAFSFALHTIGCPIVGILLDRWGIRRVSALVYLSSALGYGLLSGATNMWLLFGSKIPAGVQAGFLIAQATATITTTQSTSISQNEVLNEGANESFSSKRTTKSKEGVIRVQTLGRITAAYTLGASLGPALGGYLAEYLNDYYVGARFGVLGSIASLVLSVVFLPDSTTLGHSYQQQQNEECQEEHTHTSTDIVHGCDDDQHGNVHSNFPHQDVSCDPLTKGSDQKQPDTTDSHVKGDVCTKQRSFLKDLFHPGGIVTQKALFPLFIIKILGGIAASMSGAVLPMMLTQQLEFDPATFGYSVSCSMLTVAIFGLVGMKPMADAIGARGMAQLGVAVRAVIVLILAWIMTRCRKELSSRDRNERISWNEYEILAVSMLYALTTHALATGLTTLTTSSVTRGEQGSLLGFEHSLFSLSRIVGPPVGVALFVSFEGSFWPVAITSAIIDLVITSIFVFVRER